MSEHTKGPWITYEEGALDYRPSYVRSEGSWVACCMSGGPKIAISKAEERANARLIAAAPDLLEALINARSILNIFGGDLTKYPKSEADAGRIDAIMWTAQDQIRAAIAKATGQGSGA